VCAEAPENFSAVGRWYVDFDQTTDDEVCYLLLQGATEYQHSHTEKEALARK
jgi:predicted phosphoribosyltransferase